jgi:hypothetical protein
MISGRKMVGTWGLEPQTSTVSMLLDSAFQVLTNHAGTAKYLQVPDSRNSLWVRLWVDFWLLGRVVATP